MGYRSHHCLIYLSMLRHYEINQIYDNSTLSEFAQVINKDHGVIQFFTYVFLRYGGVEIFDIVFNKYILIFIFNTMKTGYAVICSAPPIALFVYLLLIICTSFCNILWITICNRVLVWFIRCNEGRLKKSSIWNLSLIPSLVLMAYGILSMLSIYKTGNFLEYLLIPLPFWGERKPL